MNKKKSIIMSAALAASMLVTSMSAFAYTDVSDGHWAKSYINDLSGKKYLSGYEDGTYKPDNYVTRAEFAKILTNIFGVIDKSGVELADVADAAWYADTMKIAVKAGYITGYADGTVKPDDKITRQEAAVMVYRAWGLSPEGSINFTDNNEIADWASNQIATLVSKNVISGYADGSFKPNNYITRAEVAKIISTATSLGLNKSVTDVKPTGATSGAVHVGNASTKHVSSTADKNYTGGGGGSSSGKPTDSGTKKPAANPEVEAGDKQEITTAVDTSDVVDAIDAIADGTVAADEAVVLQLNVGDSYADIVKVTFFNPITGKEDTKTIAEFNTFVKEEAAKDENKDKFTTEETKKILESLTVTIPEEVGTDAKISASVEKTDGTTVVKKTEATVSINYVIESLKDYQNKKGDNNDLAVVVNLYKDGYAANEKEAAEWLKTNAKKLALYGEVTAKVGSIFADVEITESNYKKLAGYFKTMITVIDKAVEFAAEEKGGLTNKEALDYFNKNVTDAIADAVDAEYSDDVVLVAKEFGMTFASKLSDINSAAKSGATKADRIGLIWDVYNGQYK